MAGALAGLRILELGSFIAVPFASKLMADLGAEVLKVELPEGEPARHFGPFPNDIPDPEKSGLYLYMNANKRGLALDYRSDAGRKVLYELAREADVLLCDSQPRELARLGLDYHRLSKSNPGLIMTSVTAFGTNGPYSDFLACDLIAWHATGASDRYLGLADREPLRAVWYLTEHWAGVHAAGATTAAYMARLRTGQGQQVDISAAECASAMVLGYQPLTTYFATGATAKRAGYTLTFAAPCGLLPCRDGHVYLAALTPKQWHGLGKAMGDPQWARDPLFDTPTAQERMQYAEEVYQFLTPWLLEHSKEELFELCQRNGAPVTPAYTAADLESNRHLAERRFFAEVADLHAGPLKMPGAPFKMSGTPWRIRRRAPRLGEQNQEVLCGQLGFTRCEMAELMRAGVL